MPVLTDVSIRVAGQDYPVILTQSPHDLPPPTNRAPVYVDIETNGEPIYSPEFVVRTVQLYSPAWDAVYALPMKLDYFWHLERILDAAPVLVAHHAMVEWQGLSRAGLYDDPQKYWPKTVDSMLMVAVVSHPKGPVGDARLGLKDNTRALVDLEYDMDRQLKERMAEGYLEDLGTVFKSGPRKGEAKTRKIRYTWETIPIEDPAFLRYAAADVVAPHLLLDKLFDAGYTAAGEHYKKARDLSMLMQRRIVKGLRVDEERLEAAEKALANQVIGPLATLHHHGIDSAAGLTEATKAVLVQSLEEAGIDVPRTDKDGESLSKDAVFLAADGKPLPPVLLAWYEKQQAAKYKASYLDLFREALESGNGVVHPDIRIMRASTGRTSVANPPLQQLPRVGDVRGCLMADDGMALVTADLSQIEPRIAGALSKDANLLGVIASGQKMHIIVAERMFGKGYTDEQYNLSKTAGLAWLYGGGRKTIAKQTGVAMRVAGKLVRTLEDSFQGVVAYKEHLKDQTRVVTKFGREIQLDPKRPWSKMNYEIQGSAYDLFTAGTLRAAEALGDDAIWLTVHDEVLASVPKEDAEAAAHELGKALSTEFMGVPCPAIGQVVGRNWRKT